MMSKPADDKLGHAKREIKALKVQLDQEKKANVSNAKCECSMSISMLGDGCRYCQPQEYIDRLNEWLDEQGAILEKLEDSAVVPEGWKLVPIKPTRNMIDAAHDSQCITRYEATITWEEMIEASPTPPEQEPSE
jgi:hypothetical protein